MNEAIENDVQVGLFDVNRTARYLSVSPKTVLNLVERGYLKPVRIERRRMFRRVDVEKLARTGTK